LDCFQKTFILELWIGRIAFHYAIELVSVLKKCIMGIMSMLRESTLVKSMYKYLTKFYRNIKICSVCSNTPYKIFHFYFRLFLFLLIDFFVACANIFCTNFYIVYFYLQLSYNWSFLYSYYSVKESFSEV
jgi:hypothetical protein